MRNLSRLSLSALLLSGIVLCFAPLHAREPKATEDQCRKWNQQLEQVEKRLRAGYTIEQGNKLNERRRQLMRKLRNRCR